MPLDRSLFESLARSNIPQREDLDEDVFSFARELVETLPLPKEEEEAQRKEAERAAHEQRQLAHARGVLESSPIPGLRALTTQVGADIVGAAARLAGQGEYADRMNRFSNSIEQAARERDERSIVPTILTRGARGAGRSLGTAIPAGMVAGPYGVIATASGMETNRAITEGRDAGKKGRSLAEYAIVQGVIEGTPAAVMQKFGLGGFESVFGKKTISVGVREGLERLGITLAQELPEEIVTELGHNVAAKLADVDPSAVDPDVIAQTIADTVVQTGITVGFGGAPGVVRSVQAGKVAETTEQIATYAREGKVPSRKTWREWKLERELGESRSQRRAFTQEVARQLEEGEIPPVGQPAPALTEVAKAPVEPGEEVRPPGVYTGPEAATEAQAVLEMAQEAQAGPEVAAEALAPPVDEAVALNKATGAEIRETLNLPELGEEAVQSFDTVLDDVAVSKADEQALDVAREVTKSRRQITSHEHVAMVLKAGKLLNELDTHRATQAGAATAGNIAAHEQATDRIENTVEQLDLLTEATRHSRREIARALSIGRLRLNRENFDVVSVMQQIQVAKGPEGKLTTKERGSIERHTKEHAVLVDEVTSIEEEARIKEEEAQRTLAQKVLTANKPRRRVGRSMRERAVAEREDIKQRIRQLGLRVNDITGVSAEGTYLIGRLGITYIKEGVGTLVGVIEQLRGDMPDLNLTDQDVYQALVSRSPKEKTRVRSEATKRVTRLKSMAKIHIEIEEMAQGIFEKVSRKRAPVPKDLKALREKLKEVRTSYYESDINAAKLERAIETVNRLQDQLDSGLISIRKDPGVPPPELTGLHEQARQLRTEMRVDEELAKADMQLQTGVVDVPIKRVKKPVSRKLERKQIELKRKRNEIRQMIADATPWTTKKIAKEVAFTLKAIKATADLSFTMRQNLWQVFSHPKKASKAFIPSLKAFFSEYSSDQILNALQNSENAFLYEQAGLVLQDASSPDAQQRSEVFRGQVLERAKIFGKQNPFGWVMSASARHAVTISNLMRTSAFDHFIANNPNATQEEMRVMADYINVSTGLGHIGMFGKAAETVETVFFSPKFAVSRIQTPFKLAQYWSLPRVRKQITRDMIKVISTGGMILTLAALAGFGVEFLDPDEPDWGKIRIGDMRVDIWGGFQQPARVVARLARSPFKKPEISPIDVLGRFAAFKFAPVVTLPVELVMEETAVGEEVTKVETMAKAFVPLVFEDIMEAWKEEGLAAGITTGALATLGVGVGTYADSETATRRKIAKLRAQKKYTTAERLRSKWNQENPKQRIITVKGK